jgi:hypothetical protein
MSDEIKQVFSLQNIVKFIVLVVGIAGVYYNLESRVVILEFKIEQIRDIRDDIKEIKTDVKKLYIPQGAR